MNSIPLISHRLFVAAVSSERPALPKAAPKLPLDRNDKVTVALLEPVDSNPPLSRATRLWRAPMTGQAI